jgi:hypothetical protein
MEQMGSALGRLELLVGTEVQAVLEAKAGMELLVEVLHLGEQVEHCNFYNESGKTL